MPNQRLVTRLDAIIQSLVARFGGGKGMTSVSAGGEREAFVNEVLRLTIAEPFRIGTGEITDSKDQITGQLDIVIEYARGISFALTPNGARLYLAESAAAAVEVKSDLVSQWSDVVAAAKKIGPIRRALVGGMSYGPLPDSVPLFAVGYKGWQQPDTLEEKRAEAGVQGVLSLQPPLYTSSGTKARGAFALLGFLMDLQAVTSSVIGMQFDYARYAT